MDKQLLSGVSPAQAAKELNRIAETVTCLECCKLYNLPETAACGHTLCHGCWIGRQACAICALPLTRLTLRANAALAKNTQCVQSLITSFEKLFGTKLEEFAVLPIPVNILNKDSNKNVRTWLADSQNQFSDPISTQQSTQGNSFAVEVKTSDIQVYTVSKKPALTPLKVVVAPAIPQEDWDKIETIPDSEEITRNKVNVGPRNQQLFAFDDEEYTTDHSRRISRKRKLKNDWQNWINLKKMRKEYSKLHKKNKNKLNVSIEMCKKKSANSKPTTTSVQVAESQQAVTTIDDCTTNITEKVLPPPRDKMITVEKTNHDHDKLKNDKANLEIADVRVNNKHVKQSVTQEECKSAISPTEKVRDKIPFLKKNALQTQSIVSELKDTNTEIPKSTNHTIDCNDNPDPDDIQITIKTGSILTNIFIKKKKNDVQVKLYSDQEVQTKQSNVDKSILYNMTPSANSVCDVQNIEINNGGKHVVSAVTQKTNDSEARSRQNKKAILDKTISTTHTQKRADKRDMEINDDETPKKKKLKVTTEINTIQVVEEIENNNQNKDGGNQSRSMNYDLVMEQVFASIDADMDSVDESQSIIKDQSKLQDEIPNTAVHKLKTQKTQRKVLGLSKLGNATQNVVSKFQQKDSENLFTQSIRGSQIEPQQKHGSETQTHIENLLTLYMCRDLASTNAGSQEAEDVRIEATPCLDEDDSDMSIYEETPEKTSFSKKSLDQPSGNKVVSRGSTQKSPTKDSADTEGILKVSDTENTKTNITVCEAKLKEPLQTPNMKKFYDDINRKSSPFARKSLIFVSVQDEGNKSLSVISKNTQEREISDKAFKPSQKSLIKPMPVFPVQKLCVAASCLTQAEVKVLEALCKTKKWDFVREYTKDLTHLVVGVDKKGKSQRTVKFMCAVASGKWIVKYDWVTACIKRGTKVPEWSYEALDWTGDPGPMRARHATSRLFEGFTFFCKPPFTVLSEDVLKTMLEGAGGAVVTSARQIRVTGADVKLLLAEPEHTQENQFTYLALELNIVPVNYEWALNCIGSYALSSISELLLCPACLLPAATRDWPSALMQDDAGSSDE